MADVLIVGAGLFGAIAARELTDAGLRVVVVEKRHHIGGQCATEVRDGQVLNLYGGHIFHTNDERLWEYANRFAHFRQYSHHVKATAGGVVYSFPPNKMTYQQLGTKDEKAIREKFFVGYTEKMWGRAYSDVPASVTARIPLRDTWNDEYFSDAYQGLPEGGYTPLFERLLAGVDVRLGVDYLEDRYELDQLSPRVIYTGPIDALFGYDAGRLDWRGMRFELRREEMEIYQGCATMNYCDADVPWLREEEYKFFWPVKSPYTWISRHYPDSSEPLYPVNDARNNRLAADYQARAESAGYILGGRLASYMYLDMHQVIAQALKVSHEFTRRGFRVSVPVGASLETVGAD